MHIALFIKFLLLKDFSNMFCYDCPISTKQFGHLVLRQPYSLSLNPHFQPRDFIRLINNDFTSHIIFFVQSENPPFEQSSIP